MLLLKQYISVGVDNMTHLEMCNIDNMTHLEM